MTDIIQRMIDRAIESGSITSRQKKMILTKAKKAGDDVDEVEIILDSIPTEEEPVINTQNKTAENKFRKCPHCGAVLSGITMTCPECGYVFTSESITSKSNRDYLQGLQKKIDGIRNRPMKRTEDEFDYDLNRRKEILDAIGGFSIPVTQEGLVQVMISCYSRYEASKDTWGGDDEAKAWFAKAKECYLLLQSVSDKDAATLDLVEKYGPILNKKKMDDGLMAVIVIALMAVMVIAIVCFG